MENRPDRPQRPDRPLGQRRFYDAQNRAITPKPRRDDGPAGERPARPENRYTGAPRPAGGLNRSARYGGEQERRFYTGRGPETGPADPESYRSLDDFDRRDAEGGQRSRERGAGFQPAPGDDGRRGAARDAAPRYGNDREERGADNNRGDSRGEHPRYPNNRPAADRSIDMIFGLRPIMEALSAGRTLEKIFLLRGTKNSLVADISSAARAAGIPVQQVPGEKLDGLTRKNHQGAVAYVSPIDFAPLDGLVSGLFEEGKVPFLLLLDRITDVRNFGAIARTAECLGVQAIVVPGRGAAQINGDALKTSAGALNLLPVCRENDLRASIEFLQQSGVLVVACTEKADEVVGAQTTDFSGPIAVLMGSEEDGISPELLRMADVKLRVPMTGQIQSLNVSVAAGIMLFEVARQRQG